MDPEQIRKAVLTTIELIAPETDVQAIRPDRPLRQQIDLDSVDWLNFIAGLHERLSVDIPDADIERLVTLDALVAYLASRPAQAPRERLPGETPSPLPCAQHVINGATVTVRPLRSEDLPLEADFVRTMSADARYQRFMATLRELPEKKLHYLTEVDQVHHVALAATVDRDGKEVLVGAVRYIIDTAGTGCEFAIELDDAWHRSGLAGILMHILIGIARSRGLATMEGFVLATNTRMLKFTRQLGFKAQRDPDDRDTIHVVRAL